MLFRGCSALLIALACCQCAQKVTRAEALATAHRYTQVSWLPDARHARHGPDAHGIEVQTPDASLMQHGFQRGWWRSGQTATGMPYQWGGFDTPESFQVSLKAGKFAGDISTPFKRQFGDAVVSKQACGIDCSGFVSRCWNLKRPVSTKQLPTICDRLASWDLLKPGDILLNERHVVLFVAQRGDNVLFYEAGPFPVWRVSANGCEKEKLLKQGYTPWRYRNMRDDT